jgi:hypothetical protein
MARAIVPDAPNIVDVFIEKQINTEGGGMQIQVAPTGFTGFFSAFFLRK